METVFDEDLLKARRIEAAQRQLEAVNAELKQLSSEESPLRATLLSRKEWLEKDDGSKCVEAMRAKLTQLGEFMGADRVELQGVIGAEQFYLTKGEKILIMVPRKDSNERGAWPEGPWLELFFY